MALACHFHLSFNGALHILINFYFKVIMSIVGVFSPKESSGRGYVDVASSSSLLGSSSGSQRVNRMDCAIR